MTQLSSSLPMAGSGGGLATIYLLAACLCLILAVRLLGSALAPIGLLVRTVAAVMLVMLSIGAALTLLAMAALGGGLT